MAQRAIEGDQEALDYLDLEESDVKWTTASTLTWETLRGNYNYCAHVLVVATHLKLDTMHRTSRYALQSLTWIEAPPLQQGTAPHCNHVPCGGPCRNDGTHY